MGLQNLTYAWILIGTISAIAEMVIPKFALIFVALAAFAAASASALGKSLPTQGTTFVVVLFLGLLLLRPRVVKRLQSSRNLPSRTDTLIGKIALVTEEISTTNNGRVEIDGICWTATAPEPVAPGSQVTIEGADGIVLKVKAH